MSVRHERRPLQIGLVEDVTADGSILWLAANGVETRVLIDRAEGYEICEPFGAELSL